MDLSKRTISAVLAMTMVFSFLPKVTVSATEEDIFVEPTVAETQEWTEPTVRDVAEDALLPTEIEVSTQEVAEKVAASSTEDLSEYPEIKLDEPMLVTIETAYEEKYFRFTSPCTDLYKFYSTGNLDTSGAIYTYIDGEKQPVNCEYAFEENNLNFILKSELEEGQEYLLRSSSSETGSYNIIIETIHKPSSTTIIKPPCTEEGLAKHTCSYCGCTYTETLPKGHIHENGICTICGTQMCGDDVTWAYHEDTKTLTISGAGDMYDYYSDSKPWVDLDNSPWYDFCEDIERVIIEEGVTSISGGAFCNCINLVEAEIASTVERIGYSAFENCTNLLHVTLPEELKILEEWSFQNCSSLRAIEVPGSVTRVSYRAFSNCTAMSSVDLPENLQRIDYHAFSNCTSLTEIDIPKDVMEISYNSFEDCTSLKTVKLPSRMKKINAYAFQNCASLEDVVLPDVLTFVGNYAFSNCTSLQGIAFSEHFKTLCEGAFDQCTSLTNIRFSGDVPTFDTGGNTIFSDVVADAYYPANNSTWLEGHRANYGGTLTWIPYNLGDETSGTCGENLTWNYDKQTQTLTISGQGDMYRYKLGIRPWETYCEEIGKIVIEEGVTSISENAFQNCVNLSEIDISNTVTRIADRAFINCSSLEQIDIPDSVMELSYYCFEDCTSLSKVTLPAKLQTIGGGAFQNCANLREIEIPDSVMKISYQAFANCNALSAVTLPEALEQLDDRAFSNCTSLKEMDIPDGVMEMSYYCFENCTSLQSIKLPSALYGIDVFSFKNCSALRDIEFPEGLRRIKPGAFFGCEGLSDIYFTGDVPVFYDDNEWHIFQDVVADAYYPEKNTTWTEDDRQNYGGTITWIPYNPDSEAAGTCGENVVWQLSEGGQLTISGTSTAEAVAYGARSASNCRMDDYSSAADTPWYSLREQIKTVLIEGNVDYVGSNAFSGCPNLTSVSIEDGVGEIHSTAFSDSPALETVYYGGSEEAWNEMDVDTGDAQVHYNGSTATAHTETKRTVAPTCTEKGYDLYECSCGSSRRENETDALGHDLGDPVFDAEAKTHTRSCSRCDHSETEDCIFDEGTVTKEPTEDTPGEKEFTCTVCDGSYTEEIPAEGHEHSYTAVVTDPTCTEQGYTTYTCSCGDTYIDDYVDPTGHNYENGVCTVCQDRAVKRISGQNRIETALEVAKTLKEVLGVEKFNTIIIANGEDTRFADALTGSYLANVKGAPILMYTQNANEALTAATMAFIQENLSRDGMIYLLGGEATLPENVKASLADYKVERLSGKTRFDTNLRILEEAGVGGNQEILIAKGYNFADSLSASATGLPILVVNDVSGKLTEEQIAFLEAHKENSMTILGGTSSISEDLEAQIEEIVGKNIDRVYGMRRENTSVAIAERYFPNADFALVTYSRGSADGLCGGPLAYAKNAPLLLTASGMESVTNAYIASHDITSGYILGGTATISEDTAEEVFGTAETK